MVYACVCVRDRPRATEYGIHNNRQRACTSNIYFCEILVHLCVCERSAERGQDIERESSSSERKNTSENNRELFYCNFLQTCVVSERVRERARERKGWRERASERERPRERVRTSVCARAL